MMKEGLITPEPQTTEDEILDPDIGALLAQIMAANGQEMTMQVADAPIEPAKIADIVADTTVAHAEERDIQEEDQKSTSMYSISDDDEDEDNTMFSITTDDADDMSNLDADADADIDMQLNLDDEPVDTFTDFSGAVHNIAIEEDDNVAVLLTEEPKAIDMPSVAVSTPAIDEGVVDVNDVLAQVSQDLKTVFSTDSEEDTLTNLTAQFEQMHINPSSAPTAAEKDIPALLNVTPNEAVNVEEIMAQVTHDIQANNPDTEDTLANLTEQFERMHLGEPLKPSSKSKYVNEHNEIVDVKEIMAQVAHDLNTNVNADDTLLSLTEQFERIKQEYPVDNHKVHASFGISKEEIHRSELRAKAAETTAGQLKASEHTEPLTTDDKLEDVIQAEQTVESTPEVDNTIHEAVATVEEVQTIPPVITPETAQPQVEQNSVQGAHASTEHHATESLIPERRKDTEAPTRGGFLTNATLFTKAATSTPRRPERKPTPEIVEETRVNQRVSEIMKANNPQGVDSNRSRVEKYRSEKIGDIDLVLLTEEGVFNDIFKLLSKHVNDYVTEITSLKNQLQASLTAGTNATAQPDYELLTQLAMMEEENNNLKIDNTSLTRRVDILEHEMATVRKKYEDLMLEMMDVQADNTRLEKALGNL